MVSNKSNESQNIKTVLLWLSNKILLNTVLIKQNNVLAIVPNHKTANGANWHWAELTRCHGQSLTVNCNEITATTPRLWKMLQPTQDQSYPTISFVFRQAAFDVTFTLTWDIEHFVVKIRTVWPCPPCWLIRSGRNLEPVTSKVDRQYNIPK